MTYLIESIQIDGTERMSWQATKQPENHEMFGGKWVLYRRLLIHAIEESAFPYGKIGEPVSAPSGARWAETWEEALQRIENFLNSIGLKIVSVHEYKRAK